MKTLSLLAALALAFPAVSFGAPARLPEFLSPADAEALQAVRAAAQRWTSIYLQADCWGGSSCRVSENNLRINLHGNRTGWGSFNFNGQAGNESVHYWADPTNGRDPRDGYFINGSQTNLRLSPSGNSYWLTGSIGRRSVSITFNRFGSGWSMYGQSGLNLNLSGFNQTINASGNVDLDQFGPSELAAFGAVLAVLASLPAAK